MQRARAQAYTLEAFVDDLRRIAGGTDDPARIVAAVRPLAGRLATERGWVRPAHYGCDEAQGFGVHLLHEEPDHSLAVFAVAWLPGRGAPPHDHGTWAVVAGVDGPERNTFWRRLDDRSRPGYAELRKAGEKVFAEGDVLTMLPGAIHSVDNCTGQVTLSLHVYGRHINHTDRSSYDPEAGTEQPFKVKQA